MKPQTEYEPSTSVPICVCDGCWPHRVPSYRLPTQERKMMQLPADFKKLRDASSLYSWDSQRRRGMIVLPLESGEAGPWLPLQGRRSAFKLAPWRAPSSTRDAYGVNRILPGIRTLDIWQPWRCATPTLPETVDQHHPPNNVAYPTSRMTASSSRSNSSSSENKRKREPAPLQLPSYS